METVYTREAILRNSRFHVSQDKTLLIPGNIIGNGLGIGAVDVHGDGRFDRARVHVGDCLHTGGIRGNGIPGSVPAQRFLGLPE